MGPIPNIQGGAGGAAGPSGSGLTGGNSSFDSSNWTVSTGSSSASAFDMKTLLIAAGLALLGVFAWTKLAK